jgi:hypothetical protein
MLTGRTGLALRAVVAILTLGAFTGSPPLRAAPAEVGAAWPDGVYTVSLASHATLPGAGFTNAAGDFVIEIENGSGATPYVVEYTFTGVGVSTAGTVLRGTMLLRLRGDAVASGGRVELQRSGGEIEWLEVCDGGTCIDPRTSPFFRVTPVSSGGADPLVRRGSSCGLLEGDWDGVVEDLIAGVPGLDLGTALDGLRTTFVAGSAGLGDIGLWLAERDELLAEFEGLMDGIAMLPSAELDATARRVLDLVARGEALRDELTTDYCPDFGTGEIGIGSMMRDLFFAMLGNPSTSPSALADFLTAAIRAGVLPTGDLALDEAVLDRIRELEPVTVDPSTRYRFAFAAGLLGDRALADALVEDA